MPKVSLALLTVLSVPLLFAGCAGPEAKLGRGINNVTEFVRGGEITRSMEQSAFFGNTDASYTTGFIHGFNRSVARTFVGAYEIVTFPIPNHENKDYSAIYFPENPVYPATYTPGIVSDSIYQTDTALGFSGGDVAPWMPGSRFKIFDN